MTRRAVLKIWSSAAALSLALVQFWSNWLRSESSTAEFEAKDSTVSVWPCLGLYIHTWVNEYAVLHHPTVTGYSGPSTCLEKGPRHANIQKRRQIQSRELPPNLHYLHMLQNCRTHHWFSGRDSLRQSRHTCGLPTWFQKKAILWNSAPHHISWPCRDSE